MIPHLPCPRAIPFDFERPSLPRATTDSRLMRSFVPDNNEVMFMESPSGTAPSFSGYPSPPFSTLTTPVHTPLKPPRPSTLNLMMSVPNNPNSILRSSVMSSPVLKFGMAPMNNLGSSPGPAIHHDSPTRRTLLTEFPLSHNSILSRNSSISGSLRPPQARRAETLALVSLDPISGTRTEILDSPLSSTSIRREPALSRHMLGLGSAPDANHIARLLDSQLSLVSSDTGSSSKDGEAVEPYMNEYLDSNMYSSSKWPAFTNKDHTPRANREEFSSELLPPTLERHISVPNLLPSWLRPSLNSSSDDSQDTTPAFHPRINALHPHDVSHPSRTESSPLHASTKDLDFYSGWSTVPFENRTQLDPTSHDWANIGGSATGFHTQGVSSAHSGVGNMLKDDIHNGGRPVQYFTARKSDGIDDSPYQYPSHPHMQNKQSPHNPTRRNQYSYRYRGQHHNRPQQHREGHNQGFMTPAPNFTDRSPLTLSHNGGYNHDRLHGYWPQYSQSTPTGHSRYGFPHEQQQHQQGQNVPTLSQAQHSQHHTPVSYLPRGDSPPVPSYGESNEQYILSRSESNDHYQPQATCQVSNCLDPRRSQHFGGSSVQINPEYTTQGQPTFLKNCEEDRVLNEPIMNEYHGYHNSFDQSVNAVPGLNFTMQPRQVTHPPPPPIIPDQNTYGLEKNLGPLTWTPTPNPIIRINNIPWDVTIFDIQSYLHPLGIAQLGGLPLIHVLMVRETGKTKSDAYVELDTMNDAMTALRERQRRILRGRVVTLHRASQVELLRLIFPSFPGDFRNVDAILPEEMGADSPPDTNVAGMIQTSHSTMPMPRFGGDETGNTMDSPVPPPPHGASSWVDAFAALQIPVRVERVTVNVGQSRSPPRINSVQAATQQPVHNIHTNKVVGDVLENVSSSPHSDLLIERPNEENEINAKFSVDPLSYSKTRGTSPAIYSHPRQQNRVSRERDLVFVTRAEINQCLAVCKNFKLFFSRKCPQRPFETVIIILLKFPWHQKHFLSTMQRDHLFELTKLAIETLKMHLSKPSHSIDPTLLDRMLRVIIMVPAFTERQKYIILEAVGRGYQASLLGLHMAPSSISPSIVASGTSSHSILHSQLPESMRQGHSSHLAKSDQLSSKIVYNNSHIPFNNNEPYLSHSSIGIGTIPQIPVNNPVHGVNLTFSSQPDALQTSYTTAYDMSRPVTSIPLPSGFPPHQHDPVGGITNDDTASFTPSALPPMPSALVYQLGFYPTASGRERYESGTSNSTNAQDDSCIVSLDGSSANLVPHLVVPMPNTGGPTFPMLAEACSGGVMIASPYVPIGVTMASSSPSGRNIHGSPFLMTQSGLVVPSTIEPPVSIRFDGPMSPAPMSVMPMSMTPLASISPIPVSTTGLEEEMMNEEIRSESPKVQGGLD